jgi:CrcB protein
MEAASKILAIAAGGAIGSVARYLVNISPLANVFEKFPFPTFLINVSGSFLIGFFLILLTDRFDPPDFLRMAIMVGFLGAFTTFSTFEIEIYGLITEGQGLSALAYLLLSVAVGFVGLLCGIGLAKTLL